MSWFKRFFCSHMLCQMGKNIFYKLLLKWVQNTALKFGTAEFPVDRGQTAWSTQVKLTCCWVPPRGKLSGWSSTLTLIFLFLLSSKENSYPVPWLEGSEKLLPVLLKLKNQRDRKAGRRITLAAEEGHWIHRVNTSVVCVTPKSFTHLYILPCIAPKPKDPDSDFCSYTLLKIKQTLNQPHKHPEDLLGQQAFGTFWMTMTLPHFPHHQLFPLESAGEQIPPTDLGGPRFCSWDLATQYVRSLKIITLWLSISRSPQGTTNSISEIRNMVTVEQYGWMLDTTHWALVKRRETTWWSKTMPGKDKLIKF